MPNGSIFPSTSSNAGGRASDAGPALSQALQESTRGPVRYAEGSIRAGTGTSDVGTHVVVVIQGPYEHWKETDAVKEITHDVLDETDWVAPVTSHHVSHDSAVAKRMKATERVDILAALSRRYREAYGDRLSALYALPRNPFEPEEEHGVENLDIVVVLRDVEDHFAETDGVVEVAMDVEREYDFEYGIFPHHASEDDDFVQVAREEGVRL